MSKKSKKEVRVAFMLPGQLNAELKRLPLVFLPVAPLEWHGPHLALGMDAFGAEWAALAVARRVGGVVMPTLVMGTERERPPQMLESLGFARSDYVVGMNFPKAKGLYKSFYFPEEVFAVALRGHLELCIEHGYQHIFIVNGHGAANQIETIRRLAIEFSHKLKGVTVGCALAFPKSAAITKSAGHGGALETSLMMYKSPPQADLSKLPPKSRKLKYTDYSIVDSGGFDGKPGPGHAVPPNDDPRLLSTRKFGRRVAEETVNDLVQDVAKAFGLRRRA